MRGTGFLVVYLAWACGLGVLLWAGRALVVPQVSSTGAASAVRRDRLCLALLAVVVLSLALPWIGGPAADGGGTLVLSGWRGLDVASLAAIVVLVALVVLLVLRPAAGGEDRRLLLAGATTSVAGIVVGNAVIQLTEPAGSRLQWGAGLSVLVAVLAAVLALWPGRER